MQKSAFAIGDGREEDSIGVFVADDEGKQTLLSARRTRQRWRRDRPEHSRSEII